MKHLNDLNRSRPFKLYNFLPEEIAKNDPPTFFIPSHNNDVKITAFLSEKPQVFLQQKIKAAFKRVGAASTVVTRLMNHKRSSSRVQTASLTKSPARTLETTQKNHEFSAANPIKFVPYSINRSALFDKGCVTCGKDNICVKYYGERHMCLRCREFLRTQNNEKACVFLNDAGEISAVAERKTEKGDKTYYYIEPDLIWFKDFRCYATLAQEDELIVLIHDNQTIRKTREKREIKSILKEKI